MATARDIIRRALRIARVLDGGTAGEASDFADAFGTLNALLAEMHEADIGLPDYAFTTIESEVASDIADREALAYQLALRISPEYGGQLSPQDEAMAHESMNRLRLRYFQPGSVDAAMPSARHSYSVDVG